MSSLKMKLLVKDIVGSKGYHVYQMWSHKNNNVDAIVKRLNNKIKKVSGLKEKETTIKPLFVQQKFEF